MNEEQLTQALVKEQPRWSGREDDIVMWLENFRPEHRLLALRLLRKIQIYSIEDCHRWCKRLHLNLDKEIRESDNTFYVGVGLPSESGSMVSCFYREANQLPTESFLELGEVTDSAFLQQKNARTLIFLDDFIGSGNQAVEFWRALSSRLGWIVNDLDLYYFAFIGRSEGKEKIETNTRFRVQIVRRLDESDKAFGVGSKVFSECFREMAKEVFWEYGARLFPKYPLGFRGGELLVVLAHNTPNNTLPVLWSEKDWAPLFKRYEKVRLSPTGHWDMGSNDPSLRQKAVMFIEQVDLKRNTAGPGVLEADQVAFEQNLLTIELVRNYGGSIIKSLKAKCLIQFSSCKDALSCGFALQQRVADRNAKQSDNRLVFEVRVGIDSGEVVMLPDGNLLGDSAHRATRVCAQCSPGEVYFTESAKSGIDELEGKFSVVGSFPLSHKTRKEYVYRLLEWTTLTEYSPNPFIWRGGITSADDFFDRDREQEMIRDYLEGRQNCQIVGPRRIGKTSLLRRLELQVEKWMGPAAVTAYIDLQSPRSFTLEGWLEQASRQLKLAQAPGSLADFSEAVESALSSGSHPILLLDEFEELTLRPMEFTRDFFLTLRSCGQLGMSIITASRKPIGEIIESDDSRSSFYNTFALIPLTTLTQANAETFVDIGRNGMVPFNSDERKAVLEFAKGHPLALQVSSFHILQGRRRSESVSAAIRRANDDMKAHLPSW